MAGKKKTSENKVKCRGCHAYFVEEDELCANCEAKENPEEEEEEEEEEED